MDGRTVHKTLNLTGLSCLACETKIEKKLEKLKGVQEVKVSYVTFILDISYEPNTISLEEIIHMIEQLGYGIRQEEREEKKEKVSYFFFIGVILLLLGAYLLIKNTVGFQFVPEINENMGYGILFLIGLLSSIHCVAMCGGINLTLCISDKTIYNKKDNYGKIVPSMMYHSGRIISYTVIGGIVGAIGSIFKMSSGLNATIALMAGVFMLMMGLNMLQIFPVLRKLIPHFPKKMANRIEKEKYNKVPFVVGLLNGFMPCGPLQAMQIYALGTGSFIAGAFSMLAFSVGTVPLLFVFGTLGTLLSAKYTKQMIKGSAILVMFLGLLMINRGFAFAGVTVTKNPTSQETSQVIETVETKQVQEISTTLHASEYEPITVQAGIPVKWTINADSSSLNGCNGTIIIPEYEVEQKLNVGENVITFTPTEAGTYGYSCWMGMIQSSITVTENNTETSGTGNEKVVADNTAKQPKSNNSGTKSILPSMGCCSGL